MSLNTDRIERLLLRIASHLNKNSNFDQRNMWCYDCDDQDCELYICCRCGICFCQDCMAYRIYNDDNDYYLCEKCYSDVQEKIESRYCEKCHKYDELGNTYMHCLDCRRFIKELIF